MTNPDVSEADVDDSIQTKTCTKCGAVKPLDKFHLDNRVRDGRTAACRDCKNAATRSPEALAAKRVYYQANRARIREQQASYRRDNREASRTRDAKYREREKERLREYQQAYYVRNRQRAIERAIQWAKDNPTRFADNQHRRRALLRGRQIGPVDLEALWTGSCSICGEEMDRSIPWPDPKSPSIDHVVPISKGGSHTQDNLAWACLGCNMRKSNRMPN